MSMNKENNTKQTNLERINKVSLLDVIDKASVKLNDKIIHIKKHSDKTILIYDKNDDVLYSQVKPILREVNNQHKLNIDLKHSSGSVKVTRTLGREVINKLNHRNI